MQRALVTHGSGDKPELQTHIHQKLSLPVAFKSSAEGEVICVHSVVTTSYVSSRGVWLNGLYGFLALCLFVAVLPKKIEMFTKISVHYDITR